jgi:hypothetical protein
VTQHRAEDKQNERAKKNIVAAVHRVDRVKLLAVFANRRAPDRRGAKGQLVWKRSICSPPMALLGNGPQIVRRRWEPPCRRPDREHTTTRQCCNNGNCSPPLALGIGGLAPGAAARELNTERDPAYALDSWRQKVVRVLPGTKVMEGYVFRVCERSETN